jgi:GGDEF domain-containing protein
VRGTLADARPGGLAVTACFGISCGWGDDIEFTALFHAADQALLEGKAAGTDTVIAAEPPDPPASRAA